MTLIIYAKCADGIVLISDRQASIGGGEKITVDKIYSPEDKQFIIALAGDGSRIEQVYSTFDTNPSLRNGDLKSIVKSVLDSSFSGKSDDDVEGIMIIKDKSKYNTFRISSIGHITIIRILSNPFECFGSRAGKTVATFISQYEDIKNKTLSEATDFLISTMDTISKNFDGIGTLQDGFSILSISKKGDFFESSCFTKNYAGKISLKFTPSGKNLLSSFPTISSKNKQKIGKKSKTKKTYKKKRSSVSKIPIDTPLSASRPVNFVPLIDISSAILNLENISPLLLNPNIPSALHSISSLPSVTGLHILKDLPAMSALHSISSLPSVTGLHILKDLPAMSALHSISSLPSVTGLHILKDLPQKCISCGKIMTAFGSVMRCNDCESKVNS